MSDSQPASANRAVFLSYASQDAEAAKRICEALRGGRVEVWFDVDGGLEHGDEWDAKIRRQIKECVLFIPVISASTQARHEGYFRIEWDLAAERARGIASGVPFILPVVIDDTREPDALVPDRFRMVQWTKLRGGEVPPDVQQRFLKLWSHRTGVLKHEAGERGTGLLPVSGSHGQDARATATAASIGRPGAKNYALLTAAIAVVVVSAGWWLLGGRGKPPAAESSPKTAATGRLSETQELVAKMWAELNKPELARAELEIADDLGKRATALNPQDADAWAAWSQVDSWMIYHNFATAQERADSARTKVTRALGLAPDAFEPRLAQACFLVRGAGESGISSQAAQAEALLRALLRERPAEPRALLALGILLRNLEKPEETRATLLELAKNPSFAALAWNELGWAAYHFSDWPAAEAAADRSLEIRPSWGALMLKFETALWTRGDLALAKTTLDRMPLNVLQEDWVVAENCEFYAASGQPEQVLRVLTNASRDWLRCGPFVGPTDYLAGLAHDMLKQPGAARLSWQAALKQIELRLAATPKSGFLVFWKGELLVRLGERAEGEKLLRLSREVAAGDPNAASWFALNPHESMLLGDYDQAVRTLEANVAKAGQMVRWGRLQLDPMLKPLHGRADFEALRKRVAADPRLSPAAQSASAFNAPTADDKSVAVLAFADNSPAHDSEYFSDGISEELINALGKVPGLKVPAGTSSFYFKGKKVPMPEIAKQLGVAYVIEGSVQRAGEKVKISARLSKAADGFQVWQDTFTRDAKDVFAVEEEIAGLIAKNLSLKLGVSSAAATASVNPRATELYLQAMQTRLMSDEAAATTLAEGLFQQALKLEPRFVRAHAALTGLWLLQAYSKREIGRFDQRDGAELALLTARAREGVALDPESSDAHAALGLALALGWKKEEALDEMRCAVVLNPNDVNAHTGIGAGMRAMGEMDKALEAGRRAYELDPLDVGNLTTYGHALSEAGQYTAACAIYDRALALQPTSKLALADKATALVRLGRINEAVTIVPGAEDKFVPLVAARIMILRQAGRQSEAEALRPTLGTQGAYVWLALGRTEEALATLDPNSVPAMNSHFWVWDPLVDPIRSDPRFAKFLATLGLTEAHDRAQAWRKAHPPEKPAAK